MSSVGDNGTGSGPGRAHAASALPVTSGAVGAEIGATVIAGTVMLGRLPTEQGFTLALRVAAGACLLAPAASLAVTRAGSLAPRLAGSTGCACGS